MGNILGDAGVIYIAKSWNSIWVPYSQNTKVLGSIKIYCLAKSSIKDN